MPGSDGPRPSDTPYTTAAHPTSGASPPQNTPRRGIASNKLLIVVYVFEEVAVNMRTREIDSLVIYQGNIP